MASCISYKHNNVEIVINADQVCYCNFQADGSVNIQFPGGVLIKFEGMTDRDREALRRQLRITPAY